MQQSQLRAAADAGRSMMRMKMNLKHLSIIVILCSIISTATPALGSEDEISLFDSSARATAYIAEELTIYLWSGKPVAYLVEDDAGGFHIYGFNGKHLGWFVAGIVRDHKGKAVGAVKESFANPPAFEPFKSFKEFKPFKGFKEFAPFRPMFTNAWSDIPFKLFLLQGPAD